MDSPFHRLGVSLRDSASAIVEAAANPLLRDPPGEIERARLGLTSPRARLALEVGWLPGVSPARARQLLESLQSGAECSDAGLPATAQANLNLSEIGLATPGSAQDVVQRIQRTLQATTAIAPEALLRDINEDRAVAGIPPVRGLDPVVEALAQHTQQAAQVLKRYLDKAPTIILVEAITAVTQSATDNGQVAAGDLLEALLDLYETEALAFLGPEADTIRTLADAVLTNAKKGEAHLGDAVTQLIQLLKAWDEVAQPLQLMNQARGQSHPLSQDLARHVRGVTVQLVNEFGLIATAARISTALSDIFAELPDLQDQFAEDAGTLEGLGQSQAQRQRDAADLSYAAKIGLSQSLLSITPDEVSWDGRKYAAENVSRIRWGGTNHSVNGIPTGSSFIIAFGDAVGECAITTRNKDVYQEFTSRLWKVCGARLAFEWLQQLKDGRTLVVGNIIFSDTSVQLTKTKLFAKPQSQVFGWNDVRVWSADGAYHIAADADRGFTARSTYQADWNTHVLSNLLIAAFANGHVPLSRMLD